MNYSKKQDKTKPLFGLDKIPDKAMIKLFKDLVSKKNVEIGKLNAYIDELEAEIESRNNLTQEEIISNKLQFIIRSYDKKLKEYRSENIKMKNEILTLIGKLYAKERNGD